MILINVYYTCKLFDNTLCIIYYENIYPDLSDIPLIHEKDIMVI